MSQENTANFSRNAPDMCTTNKACINVKALGVAGNFPLLYAPPTFVSRPLLARSVRVRIVSILDPTLSRVERVPQTVPARAYRCCIKGHIKFVLERSITEMGGEHLVHEPPGRQRARALPRFARRTPFAIKERRRSKTVNTKHGAGNGAGRR